MNFSNGPCRLKPIFEDNDFTLIQKNSLWNLQSSRYYYNITTVPILFLCGQSPFLYIALAQRSNIIYITRLSTSSEENSFSLCQYIYMLVSLLIFYSLHIIYKQHFNKE